MDEKFLTIREFANKISYSERRVRQMCIDGKIEAHRITDDARKWLISTSELEKLKAGGKSTSEPRKEPYEETAHKQKMRELAGQAATEIWLPLEFASFIEERIPGDWFIGAAFRINISESGKVKPVTELEFKQHLYDALLSHLETGGFKEVVEKITDWKRESGEILVVSHKLLKMIMQDVGKRNNLLFSFDSLEQAGFTGDFFKTLYRGAIMGWNKTTPYRLKGCSLWWGAYRIYNGSPDEDLETYRNTHIELMGKYHKTDLAKQIGKQVRKLRENEETIRNQLRRFSDMEHVPGQCDLCSK